MRSSKRTPLKPNSASHRLLKFCGGPGVGLASEVLQNLVIWGERKNPPLLNVWAGGSKMHKIVPHGGP